MPDQREGIQGIDVRGSAVNLSAEDVSDVRVDFGPHHAVRIYEEDDEVRFALVATHHGFEAVANDGVPTELEAIIETVKKEHPEYVIDRLS